MLSPSSYRPLYGSMPKPIQKLPLTSGSTLGVYPGLLNPIPTLSRPFPPCHWWLVYTPCGRLSKILVLLILSLRFPRVSLYMGDGRMEPLCMDVVIAILIVVIACNSLYVCNVHCRCCCLLLLLLLQRDAAHQR